MARYCEHQGCPRCGVCAACESDYGLCDCPAEDAQEAGEQRDAHVSECDVCKLEFPSSKPNVAAADCTLGGPWGYACEVHKDAGGIGSFFEPRPCERCKTPTKRLLRGQAVCSECN